MIRNQFHHRHLIDLLPPTPRNQLLELEYPPPTRCVFYSLKRRVIMTWRFTLKRCSRLSGQTKVLQMIWYVGTDNLVYHTRYTNAATHETWCAEMRKMRKKPHVWRLDTQTGIEPDALYEIDQLVRQKIGQ